MWIHTQYINAQYHASTKNGNFCSNRLKKYPSYLLVFGLTTSLFKPSILISRLCQYGCWSARSEGEDARWWFRSESLERGLHSVGSNSESVEAEQGEDERPRFWSNMRYRVFLFTQVPPKRRVITTSGSINAPTPMFVAKWLASQLV